MKTEPFAYACGVGTDVSTDRFEWLEFGGQTDNPEPTAVEKDARQSVLDARRAYNEGEYEKALRAWSSALKTDKAQHEAWAGQVYCLIRMRELSESQTWAAKACQVFPNVAVLESARAHALAASGLVTQAMAASDVAIEIAERTGLQDAHLWLDRAACLLAHGKNGTAAFCLEKVRELRPNDADWEQDIALVLLDAGDPASALASLTRVLDKRSDSAYAWLLTARAAQRVGLRSRAQQALNEAERRRPGHPLVVEERARMHRPCWIASLVFGCDSHPSVVALRRWRDQRMLRWTAGRAAAKLYDLTAPAACAALARLPTARRLARIILTRVAGVVSRGHAHASAQYSRGGSRGQETRPGNKHRTRRDGRGEREGHARQAMHEGQGDPGAGCRPASIAATDVGIL